MEKRDNFSWKMAIGLPLAVAGALAFGLGFGKLDRNKDYKPSPGIAQNISMPSQAPVKTVHTGTRSLEKTLEGKTENAVPIQANRQIFIPNPYTIDNNFTADSEQMILARALYGESRKQIEKYPDYVYGSARTMVKRAKETGKSIKEIVLANDKTTWQYSCFNPNDTNFKRLQDPLALKEKNPEAKPEVLQKAWTTCYNLAGCALQGNLQGREDLVNVTNYYVGKPALPKKFKLSKLAKAQGIPSWAFEMNEKGVFARDNKGYLIPRKPVAEVNVGEFGTAFFYNFKYF